MTRRPAKEPRRPFNVFWFLLGQGAGFFLGAWLTIALWPEMNFVVGGFWLGSVLGAVLGFALRNRPPFMPPHRGA